jgi:hypothetical protein
MTVCFGVPSAGRSPSRLACRSRARDGSPMEGGSSASHAPAVERGGSRHLVRASADNLAHLELDGQRGGDTNAFSTSSGAWGYIVLRLLTKRRRTRSDELRVVVLYSAVMQVASLELIVSCGPGLLHCDRQSPLCGAIPRASRGTRPEPGSSSCVDRRRRAIRLTMPEGTRSRSRMPANATVAYCSRKRTSFPGIKMSQAMNRFLTGQAEGANV